MRRDVDTPPTDEQITALQALVVDIADGRTLESAPAGLSRELVIAHGLGPLAYRFGLVEFKSSYLATALAAEVRERKLAEALDALDDAAIPVILLKGMAYIQDLYDDPAERPMTDIDLMVPPIRHPDAVDVLGELGYRPGPKLAQRAETHHAMTLHRPDGDIDLHRRIIQPKRSDIDIDAVWERAVPVPGLAAQRPDPVDEALFHLTHIGRHEMNVAAISYIDGARLLRNLTEDGLLAELDSRAHSYRLSRMIQFTRKTTEAIVRGEDELDIGQPWKSILASPRELLAGVLPPRPLQLARKAALTEGPRELWGLAKVFALAQAERFRN